MSYAWHAASTLFSARSADQDVTLTVHEALSGVLGSVSLACWLFLLVPQLVENYRNQSAEAISLAFVIVWFLGDAANLFGALLANLVPTVILIAIYFCISDALLIGQVLYYGIRNKRREGASLMSSVKDVVRQSDSGTERNITSVADNDTETQEELEREASAQESEPLLSRKHSRGQSYGAYSIPGSVDPRFVREELARRRSSAGSQRTANRRRSSTAAALNAQQEPLAKIFEEAGTGSSRNSATKSAFKNFSFIFAVVLIGALGWFVAYRTGTWKPTPPEKSNRGSNPPSDAIASPAGAQFLGYASAALYLTARLPQIWKNYREQSCEGLSILFFVLSLLGNATYGAGILAHSLERQYVVKNVPWLLGSLGTIFEDLIVFWQFRLYRNNGEEQAILDEAPAGSASRPQVATSSS